VSDQPQSPQAQPVPPAPQPPPQTIRLGPKAIGIAVVIIIVVVGMVRSCDPTPTTPTGPPSRAALPAQPGSPADLDQFAKDYQLYQRGASADAIDRQIRQEHEAAERRNKAALDEANKMRSDFEQTRSTSGSSQQSEQQQEAERRKRARFADSVVRQTAAVEQQPQTAPSTWGPPPQPVQQPYTPDDWAKALRQPPPPDQAEHPETKQRKPQPLDYNPESGWPTRTLPAGTIIEAALVNRLNGSEFGPVLAQISNDAYFPGTRKIAFPQGSRFIGHASATNNMNEERLAVAFTRAIVPRLGGDYYGVSLEQDLTGLGQEGDAGLKDKVNNHYFQIFGASLAIGAIGGLSQIGNSQSGFGYDPSVAFRQGVGQGMSQAADRVMSHFLNRLPTIEIRPGTRVRIIFTDDLTNVPVFEERK